MKLEESIYPYFPEAEQLPFCLKGIGGSEYQGHVSRPEGYQWHQILLSAEGSGVLKTQNNEFKLSSGSLFFLPKYIRHEYGPVTDKWDVRWVAFDGSCCDELLVKLGMDKPVVINSAPAGKIEEIFDRMIISQKEDILYCGYDCSGLVYDLILAFHRLMDADVGSDRSRKLSTLLPALHYINDRFSEDFSLALLAQLVGVTPQHFCRLFREALNMRPTDYLLGRRLDEAKRLVRESEKPLSEIAHLSGFNDASYFSTVFRKREGMSPSAYRRTVGRQKPDRSAAE